VIPSSNGSFGMPSIASEGIHVTDVTDFTILIPTLLIDSKNPYRDLDSLQTAGVFLTAGKHREAM
jgi:hypothetical protein